MFDRTIAENIMYGDNSREVTMEEVMEAARQANVHSFITSLPGGYETRYVHVTAKSMSLLGETRYVTAKSISLLVGDQLCNSKIISLLVGHQLCNSKINFPPGGRPAIVKAKSIFLLGREQVCNRK